MIRICKVVMKVSVNIGPVRSDGASVEIRVNAHLVIIICMVVIKVDVDIGPVRQSCNLTSMRQRVQVVDSSCCECSTPLSVGHQVKGTKSDYCFPATRNCGAPWSVYCTDSYPS